MKIDGWTPCKHYGNAIGWCPKCLRGPRMSHLYVLLEDGRTPLAVEDVVVWGRWFEDFNRVVKQDEKDGVLVSTVFLGIDHNFFQTGPPLLWETLVFRGPYDGKMDRYSSYEEAVAGHERMCREVFSDKHVRMD